MGVISNKHTGFSTTMRFIDQTGQHTTSLHGASILIGRPAPNLGFSASARFTPHVFVRNNTNQPVQIHPRIRYTLFDQPNTVTLAAVTLSPNAVGELDLSPAINAIGSSPIADTGIEIDHAGSPGAVMAYAASVDQSGSNVIDVPIKDPKSEMAFKGGSYPWNIEGDNRAVLHIKNIDAPNDGVRRQAMAKLYFDGGEYNLPLQQMEAGQTVKVDIKKLRDDQVKDVVGNVIPLTVTGGQLDWNGRANKGEFIGRLIEYDPISGVASSFSCVQPCLCDPSFAGSFLYPFSATGVVNDYFQVHAIETDIDCNYFPYTFEVDANFYTSNPFVVDMFGNIALLVGGGNADIVAYWDSYFVTTHCFYTAEGDCNDGYCIYDAVTASGDTQVAVRPTVNAISPNKGLIGQPINVTITGTGFVAGSTVSIDSGSVQNVTIQSSTTMTANYTSNNNASGGNHRVTVTNRGGPSTDNVNFYVQIPTSLQVRSITTIPSSPVFSWSECYAGQDYGIQVANEYQVLDQQGQAILSSGMEPQETLTNIVFNTVPQTDSGLRDIGPSGYPGSSQFTDANGRFLDAPFGGCSNGTLTLTLTQTIRIVPLNQNNYIVRINNISVTSSSSGSGTISNGTGGDIVKTRP